MRKEVFMRRGSIYFILYMGMSGVGLILLALYVKSLLGVGIGLLVILISIFVYFAEKKSQTGKW